ncbi:MAG: DNA polymerase/3'-5' exonuclease PolX [Desulfobacteraceae bacterium]|nr:MAG: DNA polymerase/3'-5' exonuclease PolX [Desulfobacteraceae bacterium]
MENKEVARVLAEIAELLALSGENPFKIRAYAQGARIIEALDRPVSEWIAAGELARIKGIGSTLSRQITQLVGEGTLPVHQELKKTFPQGIRDMLRVPGLGPKKVRELIDRLGLRSLGELEYAGHENRLVTLPGFGKKSQENILSGIERLKKFQGRFLFGEAFPQARALLEEIQKHPQTLRAEIVGSLRRRKEIVKDIDLVAESREPEALMDLFTSLPLVERIAAKGPTKAAVLLKTGIQADLRVVGPGVFPFALHHFTGSKEHHLALRSLANASGFKINEYGLFKKEKPIACRDEAALYGHLGLDYIPPELREDWGEIEAAQGKKLPRLVEEKDLQGAFHFHTHRSDGTPTLSQWVQAAQTKGYRYLGISDHSQSAFYAGGLKLEELDRQEEEIRLVNDRQPPVRLFWGIESDIQPDGSLDYPDKVLARFDFIIASVHSKFTMTEAEMTRRIIRAIEHPCTTMLGHPTGRLLLARDPYPVDMDAVLQAAADRGVLIELNANPHRLDLDWRLMKKAKELGLKIVINPDAHHLEGLDDVAYGVGIARKGWLTKEDVFNTWEAQDVADYLEKRRRRTDGGF